MMDPALIAEVLELDGDDLLDLLETLSPTQQSELLAALPPDPSAGSRYDNPLELAQSLDPQYRDRPHLVHLSDALTNAVEAVEAGRSQWIQVSMPPRMGKSVLASTWLPTWLLHRHPGWKIGLISHSPTLSTLWGRQVRRTIEQFGDRLGVSIARDAGAVTDWQTVDGGEVRSRSIGQSTTGLGFKVLLLDDVVRDFSAAHSAAQRDSIWEWWTANSRTRLEPPSLVVAIGCLTAETPVLMGDGIEKPIADVRPGDVVMTYEDGRISASVVTNWADQGKDVIYRVTMESGRVVRGNAKHPFRVLTEEGVEEWRRLDSLRPGDLILSAEETPVPRTIADGLSTVGASVGGTTRGTGSTAGASNRPQIGASGGESSARSRSVTDLSVPRASASPTTTRPAGLRGTDDPQRRHSAEHISATDTASTQRTSTPCSHLREEPAQSVDVSPTTRTLGAGASSLLTTATTAAPCADCSATTATSSSGTVPRSSVFSLPWTTYAPGLDRVTSLVIDGYETVYDIEVARTHNFIANGLQVSNTRWHEDDFIGRLLSGEYEGDPADWQQITFPAIAEGNDVLGRSPGDPLLSPLLDESAEEALARWEDLRASVGTYAWEALYQQRPAPAKGAVFDVGWWRFYDPEDLPERWDRVLTSWDMAFKDSATSDYVVGQRWGIRGADRYLLDQVRGRHGFTSTVRVMQSFAEAEVLGWGPVTEHLVEDKANGPAVIDSLRSKVPGIVAVNPTNSKEARARAVTPQVEAGNVLLPRGASWLAEYLSEFRSFPTGQHDDQVDATTQALSRIGSSSRAGKVSGLSRRRSLGGW